jgi:hypothetical protein
MNAKLNSVTTSLTTQIQEIIGYGALHVLTWSSKADPTHWLQLSVHWGGGCHLMVQCLLPEGAQKDDVDAAFEQVGWITTQAYENKCLIYYPVRCRSYNELQDRAAEAAHQCAAAMAVLWGITAIEEVTLLGACGPRLALRRVAVIAKAPDPRALVI